MQSAGESEVSGEAGIAGRSELGKYRRSALPRGRNRKVPLARTNKQSRHSPRRSDLNLQFAPFAVIDKIRGPIPDRILMAQLQGDPFEDLVHFQTTAGEEGLPAGYVR